MDSFSGAALRDRRNLMHTQEQRRRRELIFSATRRKFLHQAQQTQQETERIHTILSNFNINSLGIREGRRGIKECLHYFTNHPGECNKRVITQVVRQLLQLPINETTISTIYATIQMLVTLGIQEAPDLVADIWKLIGASLRYINQQHGYLIIKTSLAVLGNHYLDASDPGIPIQLIFQYVNELLQSFDRGVVQETFWLLSNLLQVSQDSEQMLQTIDQEQFVICCVKFLDRFIEENNDLVKEILWLFLQIQRIKQTNSSRIVAIECLSRTTPQQERLILLSMMILSDCTSQGYKDSQLTSRITQLYLQTSPYCQREMLVCLGNLLIESPSCKQAFLEAPEWKEVLLHSLKYNQQDGLIVLFNLVLNCDGAVGLIRQESSLMSSLQPILLNLQNLPQDMISIFALFIY